MFNSFHFAATPHIHFGVGTRNTLTTIIQTYGDKVLLITGGKSFDDSDLCQQLLSQLEQDFEVCREKMVGEPSPQMVDDWVKRYQRFQPDVVLAIGGGSAVDAAKAVAGLLPSGDSVMEYLEGVGKGKTFKQPTTPLIAVPTTAGTGGETSKNAVLSVIGEHGFKKSFRHEDLVAKHIVLDPELTMTCSKEVTAACGMDAFTQLLESYVSLNASPMTDALAWSALEKVVTALSAAYENGDDMLARADMLYASSISGLTLANAGLGSVHGLASPLGAFFPIPHGVVCGSLLFEATRINIQAMLSRDEYNPALGKYAKVGRLFVPDMNMDAADALKMLLGMLELWQQHLQMPKLSDYGVSENDVERIIANISGGSYATNPIKLTNDELKMLLLARI
ncbi:iron-containing alcohol dehydrogenase [Ghiorsea bivora]|uniref:iron-containing alcohol dehydrogenase n=1 Tax=Ghiorsea bivora TaxID=1485545 RepID=UPI00056FCDE2|nr:iron-containing alcohol dehydrogenase [Ghiorsea bivora]